MADTPVPTPAASTPPENTPQPNYIARSALRIMRRAQQSLSPWAQRALQASQPGGVVQRSGASGAPSSGSGSLFSATRRPLAITSLATQGVFNKAQRVSDHAGVLQSLPVARTGAGLVRMSSEVSGHFPNIARKYESQPQPGTETLQRSELSYAGSGSAPSEPSGGFSAPSAMPDISSNDADSTINFSPDTSLTAIMASRLQAFRDAGKNGIPGGDIQATSPRQISRRAADVAARATKSEKVVMRRGSVEEVGSKPEGASSGSASVTPRQVVNESVQRKPAAPAAPSKPAATPRARPATQSYSEPAFMSEPDPYDIPDRPELPSITQELTQRYMAQRSAAAAAPKEPDDGLPSFLRKDSSGTPAFHLTARNTAQNNSDVQRKPEPSAPPRSTPPASSERPLAAPRPSVQRQAAPTEPDGASSAEPSSSDPEPAAPTVQRSAAPTPPPASSERPVAPKLTARSVQRSPASPRPAPAKPNRPASVQRSVNTNQTPTIQRKVDSSPASDSAPSNRPLVNPATPAIQRSPASEPPASTPPDQPQTSASAPASRPTTPTVQRSTESAPSVPPTPVAKAPSDLPLQRKAAVPSSTASNVEPPSIQSAPAPTSAAPAVQRQVAPAAPTPAASTPPPSVSQSDSMPVVQRQAAPTPAAPVPQPSVSQSESMPVVQRKAESAPAVSSPVDSPRPATPTVSLSAPGPVNQAASITPPAARPTAVQRKPADLPLHTERVQRAPSAEPATPLPAPTVSESVTPSLGQSVINRAQSSSRLPLSQPAPSIQRRVDSTATPRIIDQPSTSRADSGSVTTPTIQRSPDLPAMPFNAPLVSPARSFGTVQRQLAAPTGPLTLEMPERSTESYTTARPAPAPAIQRSPEPDALPQLPRPSLPLAVNRAPTGVQREVVEGPETPPASTTPQAQSQASSGPDLQELARRVYPLLKRMLAIERERR